MYKVRVYKAENLVESLSEEFEDEDEAAAYLMELVMRNNYGEKLGDRFELIKPKAEYEDCFQFEIPEPDFI